MASGAAEAVSTCGQNRSGSKPRQGGARVAGLVLAASGGILGAHAATPPAASTPGRLQLALPPAAGSPASASAPADRAASNASTTKTP